MKRSYILVFGLAFLLRLGWVLSLDERLTWSDEEEFAEIARHLAAGDGFVSTTYRANPVLPLYMGAIFREFGESYRAARVGQAVFGALTVVLVAATATRMLGPAVGTVSGVLLAVYLPHIYLSGVFYVECLFTMLVAVTIYLSLRSLDNRWSIGWGFLAGVAFGLTTLTRSVFLVYLPFLCGALLYSAGGHRRRQAAACAAVLFGVLVSILPWTIRNYRVYGRVILVSTGFGTKLWQGNNEMAAGNADDRELFWDNDIWKRRTALMDAPERQALEARYAEVDRRVSNEKLRTGDDYLATDAILMPIAVEYMWQHPGRTAVLFVKKLHTLLSSFSETLSANRDVSIRNRVLVALQYLPVLALAIAGAFLGFRETRMVWVLYALIGSIAAAYGLLNTCTRFRLPLDPYLIIFASLFVVRGWSRTGAAFHLRRIGAALWA